LSAIKTKFTMQRYRRVMHFGSPSTANSIRTCLVLLTGLLTAMPATAGGFGLSLDPLDPGILVEEPPSSRRDEPGGVPLPAPIPPSAAEEAMTPGRPLIVGAIHVEGATEIAQAEFTGAIAHYLGRALDAEALQRLARDVAEVARSAGYGLATAWVPPQSVVSGLLVVRLDEGRIDEVRVEGPAREGVERILQSLVGGPVGTAEIERRLALAGDGSGVGIGRARLVREGGRNILAVATSLDRTRVRASIDNWGSAAVGPVRARLSVDINGIIAWGDRLSIDGAATPLQPGEYGYGRLGYSVPVGNDGARVSVGGYVARSNPGGPLRDRDAEGNSYQVEVAVSYPIVRARETSLWATAELAVRDSEFERDGGRTRHDRITTARASLYGVTRAGGGRTRVRLSYVQGLGLFGATRRGDPLASRDDADGTFARLEYWAEHERILFGPLGLMLALDGQLAFQPLLSSEEMGLGGRRFLRAFDYRERSGDDGVAGVAELRFDIPSLPSPFRRAQLYTYLDAGRVTNQADGRGGGSLASAGLGLRVWAEHDVHGALELGLPISDGESGERADPRLSFTLGAGF
jgi:hemolysin activation/secretion protein